MYSALTVLFIVIYFEFDCETSNFCLKM